MMISRTLNRAMAPAGFDTTDIRMVWSFFRMTVRERVLGSSLGLIWAAANPILMMGIFTFVFGFVFKSKLPGAETSLSFIVWLISGYGPWLAIADGLNASTTSVIANSNLVKNIKFKTELLPIAAALTGVVPLIVSIAYLTVVMAFDQRAPTPAWLFMLPYLVMQFAFMMGLGLMLATFNVFVRDVQMVLPNVLLMIMFASPIFYPIEAFPPVAQTVMSYNPFYLIAEGYRQPLLFGGAPPLNDMLYTAVVAFGAFAAGLFVFRRYKNYFDAQL